MKNYKSKLVKEMNRFTRRFILVSILLFTVILVASTLITQKIKEETILKDYTRLLDSIFIHFEDNLEFNNNNQNYAFYIQNNQNLEGVYQAYYRFQSNAYIDCDVVLFNIQDQMLFSSKADQQNIYNMEYNSLNITHDMLQKKKYITSITRTKNGITTLVLTAGVFSQDELIGYVSYYYDNTAFNYELSVMQHKGSIVDQFGNVIATSTPEYISGYLKRMDSDFEQTGYISKGDLILHISVSEYRDGIRIISIVSLSDYLPIYEFGFGFAFLFAVGAYFISKRYVYLMADNNSINIARLVEQMEIIKKGDSTHRITLDTDDEFQMLSKDINVMVTSIEKIANRNAELYYMNKINEIKQLEAQFNPHFLYNTLETIRYTILFDANTASELILKLTSILRYSIDNAKDAVYFIDDLEVIQQYLAIQKYRYKERLNITFDISKECENQIIPRLMIEPLLENSIQNGFRYQECLHINVKAYIEKNTMYVIVEDDGSGISKDELDAIHQNLLVHHNKENHNGLFNINRRLSLMFGPDSSLHLESEVNMGTKAIIKIDLKGM